MNPAEIFINANPGPRMLVVGDNLLTINLETGEVSNSDSLAATEAGRVFVDYVRAAFAPAIPAPAGAGDVLTLWHLDHWTDGDFRAHIPAVRATIAKLAEVTRERDELKRIAYDIDHDMSLIPWRDRYVSMLEEYKHELGEKQAAEAKLDTAVAALREARIWHESEDKALSKQPPGGDRTWRRMMHQEQMQLIDLALSPSKGTEAALSLKPGQETAGEVGE